MTVFSVVSHKNNKYTYEDSRRKYRASNYCAISHRLRAELPNESSEQTHRPPHNRTCMDTAEYGVLPTLTQQFLKTPFPGTVIPVILFGSEQVIESKPPSSLCTLEEVVACWQGWASELHPGRLETSHVQGRGSVSWRHLRWYKVRYVSIELSISDWPTGFRLLLP